MGYEYPDVPAVGVMGFTTPLGSKVFPMYKRILFPVSEYPSRSNRNTPATVLDIPTPKSIEMKGLTLELHVWGKYVPEILPSNPNDTG
jgi:hypothetical protein